MEGENKLDHLQKQIIRSRAYSLCYYENAIKWRYVNDTMGGVVALLSACVAIIPQILNYFELDTGKILIMTSVMGGVATLIASVGTKLGAGNKQERNEKGGDEYRTLSETTERELALCTHDDDNLTILINKHGISKEALSAKYDEPDDEVLERKAKKIIRIRQELV